MKNFKKIITKIVAVILSVICILPVVGCGAPQGEMTLNPLFTDHMVLQGNKKVNIFGDGDGSVSVTVDNVTKTADSVNGKWSVTLDEHVYGGPYNVDINMNGKVTRLKDVYFGDVYLLAGQSNMEWKMKNSNDTTDLTSELCRLNWETNEKIRYFALGSLSGYEYFSPEDGWVVANKKTNIDYMSALGYNVALDIVNAKDRAVGLIGCYQGASVIESWLPEEICNKQEYNIPTSQKHNDHTTYSWNGNATLYNNVFKKAIGYTFSHVFWYQGESDTTTSEAAIYADLVTELITRWRADLNDLTLPFIMVQIADFDSRNDDAWRAIQTAQTLVPDLVDNVQLVKSYDVCVSNDIHPKDKRALAERISALID